MEETTKKVLFAIYDKNLLDNYGDFTDRELNWFKENSGVLTQAIALVTKCAGGRIDYINKAVLKQIVYFNSKVEDLCQNTEKI